MKRRGWITGVVEALRQRQSGDDAGDVPESMANTMKDLRLAKETGYKCCMNHGTITVQDGVVIEVKSDNSGTRAILGGHPLFMTLKDLEAQGWQVDGDLPAFTTEGTYIIPIVKLDQ